MKGYDIPNTGKYTTGAPTKPGRDTAKDTTTGSDPVIISSGRCGPWVPATRQRGAALIPPNEERLSCPRCGCRTSRFEDRIGSRLVQLICYDCGHNIIAAPQDREQMNWRLYRRLQAAWNQQSKAADAAANGASQGRGYVGTKLCPICSTTRHPVVRLRSRTAVVSLCDREGVEAGRE